MKEHYKKIDKIFLTAVITLSIVGFLIFISASLGLLARDSSFVNIWITQSVSLFIGAVACYFISKYDYNNLKRYAFFIFVLAIILNLIVFIPEVGKTRGGATRWIDLWFFSFQPAEVLKIAFIVYLGAFFSSIDKSSIQSIFRKGLAPFFIIFSIVAMIMYLQRDTDTIVVCFMSGMILLFISGVYLRYILGFIFMGLLSISILVASRPYIKDRIMSYINLKEGALSSSYQINQSLISIGSGKASGRGFGQSVQKFNYLPEPVSDSIYAVFSEEFGFIGSISLLFLYLFFAIRGFNIAERVKDSYGRILVVGIVSVITIQSFLNISALTAIIPLSGMPLLFVSHGGTALIFTLISCGIVLNISRFRYK